MATATIPSTSTPVADPELGENTPLIPGGLLGDDEEKPLEDVEDWTRREQAVAGVSAVSFSTSAAAMLFTQSPLVTISGILGLVVAPYAAIQQQKITHVEALAETNDRVQAEVEQLKGENAKLEAQVEELSKTVDNLNIQKDKLDTIQSVGAASIQELEKQLQETKEIHGKMKQNLTGDVLNNLIEICLAVDENEDMLLDDDELDLAITKLENIHGVNVDNKAIREAVIKNGRSMDAILDLVRDVIADENFSRKSFFSRFMDKN